MRYPTSSRRRPEPVNVVDLVLWVAAWLLAAALLAFSLGPPPSALSEFSLSDKLLHLIAYGVTVEAFLLAAVWRPGRGDGAFPRAAVAILLGAFGVTAGLEVAQGVFTTRTPDVVDALAGSAGAGVAFAAWWLLKRDRRQRT